jgi:hypothetical protein
MRVLVVQNPNRLKIFIFLFIILAHPVSGWWIDWVNCDDLLLNKEITPQSVFNDSENICFYGAGFNGKEFTISLKDPVRKLTRSMTVPVHKGVISSSWGHSLSAIDPGTYVIIGTNEKNSVCSNQNGENHCIPGDKSCTLWKFKGDIEECIKNKSKKCEIDNSSSDKDSDGDNWTDKCDAFPLDGSEWIDIDGDGNGHNMDADDFDVLVYKDKDDGITEPDEGSGTQEEVNGSSGEENSTEIPTENDNSNSTETDESSNAITPGESGDSGSSGGGGGGSGGGGSIPFKCVPEYECTYWSECNQDGKQTRACTIINNCPGPNAETEKICDGGYKPEENIKKESNLQVNSSEYAGSSFSTDLNQSGDSNQGNINVQNESGFSRITGNFITRLAENPPLSTSLIILLAISLVGLLSFRAWRKISK